MLTAFLDHLQHASAGAQVSACILAAVAIGVGPFVVANLIDHVLVARRVSQAAR